MAKTIHTRLREDFKYEGEWRISKMITHSPYNYEMLHSLSGQRWSGIEKRCLVGGDEQRKHPNYIGCVNNFESFRQFVEWSQGEIGYQEFEVNGNAWCVDKDILGNNSKIYSPNTCIFVPNRVNVFLTARGALRGDSPLGVSWKKKNRKYQAQITMPGKKGYLGLFEDPMEGHRAWQKAKIEMARGLAEEYNYHERLSNGLHQLADRLQDDLNNYRETVRL